MSLYTSSNPIINTIILDLVTTEPTSPMTIPDPYQEDKTLTENVSQMVQYLQRILKRKDRILALAIAFYIGRAIECQSTSNLDRSLCYRQMTQHYKECCLRLYTIFEPLGIEQIYRTKEVTLRIFRNIKREDVIQLMNVSLNEAHSRFSQELEN